MTTPPTPQPQPAPLPERVQQVLDATAGADTTQKWILHGPTLKGDFWLYSPREPLPGEQIAPGSEPINLIAETMGLHDARLIAAAPDLRALLAETAAALAAAEAREAGLRARTEQLELVLRNLGNNADELLHHVTERRPEPRTAGVKAALMSARMVLDEPRTALGGTQ